MNREEYMMVSFTPAWHKLASSEKRKPQLRKYLYEISL